ncbi:MAG TPA: hypothetical protein DEF00_00070 [Candidatus Taylorbacteria bacterium]|nr:MAG: hypothetical protein UY03_C0005G0019 [Parcubacteria group bacterium GW2011_GWA2_47_64]HBV00776.1 hypothetical protein [Candidatus Taylorbacteria bacterium]
MRTLLVSEEFELRFAKLSMLIQKKAAKQQTIFSHNPFHPSLNSEKIAPKERAIWTFRIDRKYRVAFRFIDGTTVLLLTVGPHDWIYKLFR